MWFKHSMSIEQKLITIYNTTMYKNKSTIALNAANVCAISYRHQHAPRAGYFFKFHSEFRYSTASQVADISVGTF